MSGSSDKGWASRMGFHPQKGHGLSFAELQGKTNGKTKSKINPSGLCIVCKKTADCKNNPNYYLRCWRQKEFGANYNNVFPSMET